jgi:hypothetical protein
MRLDGGRVDGQDFRVQRGKPFPIRLKGGQLTVSPRRVVLGVEDEDGIETGPFGQREGSSARTGEGKIRRRCSNLKHGHTS